MEVPKIKGYPFYDSYNNATMKWIVSRKICRGGEEARKAGSINLREPSELFVCVLFIL